MRVAKADRDNALTQLRRLCPPGTKVYTILKHVSRSGMCRDIDVHVIIDGEPQWLSGYVCTVMGWSQHNDCVRVGGCGMDMGFHLVHSLSYALHGTKGRGGPHGDGRLKNDGSGIHSATTPKPSRYRAGCSLIQRWL